jgi:hypothetical protein
MSVADFRFEDLALIAVTNDGRRGYGVVIALTANECAIWATSSAG